LECGGKRSATPLSQAAVILRSIRQHHPQPKRRRASLAAALHNVPPRLRDSFVNGADFQIANYKEVIASPAASRFNSGDYSYET
jgi:hypothetical protein